ncbi:MAG: hypothetical protein CUN51_04705 [Candidatus Thermofonsia Clade 1 bacterium]|uniref:Uncharacterized protein n=1 Tax=Candidatus Thermofonsia Clade 1 bacterium TaxID=2364210 RepID=A0A2M8P0V0_9CHLR|nr:MAG: hypothetical protein CUN51_04705 [Candidatus Thermofonsia Clade 1 bacterium]
MKRFLVLFVVFTALLTSFATTPTLTHAQGCTVTFTGTYTNPFPLSVPGVVEIRTAPPPGGTVLASQPITIPPSTTSTQTFTLTLPSPYTGPVYGRIYSNFTFGGFTFTNDTVAGPLTTSCGGVSTLETCVVTFDVTYTKPPGNPPSTATVELRTAPGGGGTLLGSASINYPATGATPVTFTNTVSIGVPSGTYGGVWAYVIGAGGAGTGDLGPLQANCGAVLGCFNLVGAGQGKLVRPTPLYWAPRPEAASKIVLDVAPDAKTYWVLGVDATRRFYKIVIACGTYWVPVETMIPNPDDVWRSAPLPDRVVD